jgi:hypothetical protein
MTEAAETLLFLIRKIVREEIASVLPPTAPEKPFYTD